MSSAALGHWDWQHHADCSHCAIRHQLVCFCYHAARPLTRRLCIQNVMRTLRVVHRDFHPRLYSS